MWFAVVKTWNDSVRHIEVLADSEAEARVKIQKLGYEVVRLVKDNIPD